MWILWPTKTCWHVKDLVFAWFPPNQRFKNQLIYSERCLRNLGDVYICNCWCCTVVPSFLKLWRMTRRLATLLAFLQWLHFARWNITSLLYFQKFVRIPTVFARILRWWTFFVKSFVLKTKIHGSHGSHQLVHDETPLIPDSTEFSKISYRSWCWVRFGCLERAFNLTTVLFV